MTPTRERPMSNNLTATGRNAPQCDRLTIPAAVWACKVDGVPLVAGIVDGERRTGAGGQTVSVTERTHPPGELVALRDARQPVEVRVESVCDKPHNSASACCSHAYEGGECCWCETAFRTVKGLIDVVPVVAPYSEGDGGMDRLQIYDDGTATMLSGRTWKSWDLTDLTPAHVAALGTIQPGQWAWTFTEVEA